MENVTAPVTNAEPMPTSPQLIMMRAIPAPRSEALQSEIAGHFEDDVSDEEQRGSDTECGSGQTKILVHGQRRETDVHAIDSSLGASL